MANETRAIIPVDDITPGDFFAPGSNVIDVTLAKVKEHVEKIVADPTTKEGRAQIVSTARNVSSIKAAIEKKGREELKRKKASIKPFEQNVKAWADGMDGIRDDVRRPVTEIEEAEKARVAEAQRVKAEEEQAEREEFARQQAELKRQQAELERKQREIEIKEQAEKDAQEKAERQRAEAASAAKAKAQQAKQTAERKLAREREAKEQAQRDAAEAKANAAREVEQAKQQAARAAAEAEEDRRAEEQLKIRAEEMRQADEANQVRVISEAVADINACMGSETIGSVIVALIERGQVRNVTLNF